MRLPDAPLSHADEKEHRRLLALRANQSVSVSAFEEGTWEPTFTFATPGDLNVVYSNLREGRYWRIGSLVFIDLQLVNFTPTFTTASGFMQVSGLPFQSAAFGTQNLAGQLSSTGSTWPTGRTSLQAFISASTTFVRLVADGSGQTFGVFQASNFTSGSQIARLRAHGFYAIDASHP
jgi:hypothetical protein